MSLAAGLNWAWMRLCQRELSAFELATRNVAGTQDRVLHDIVAANSDTAFGRQHSFHSVRSPEDFCTRAGLGDYDTFRPWIEGVAAGKSHLLTQEPVRLLQPTSGTTSAEKLIPHTPALRAQFQRGISSWLGDLFAKRPAVRRGRAYWSISPALGDARRTSSGIRIGFDNDAEYLNPLGRIFLRHLLAVPPEVTRLRDLHSFWHTTLLHLVAANDLSLISIWNPSFLTVLLGQLNDRCEELCRDLQNKLGLHRRAAEVASIFRSTSSTAERTRQLWPQLALISCWSDAAAATPLAELRSLMPLVEIQPKGLLATEGFVSLPLCDEPGAALAIRSHFFEFTSSGASTTRLAHELQVGSRYGVVVTTAGGLYRYQLHDEIEVVGMRNECPLMRFVGKTDRTSDLVGEKLAEPFVREAISTACRRSGVEPRFALVAPLQANPPRYQLFLQADAASRIDRVAQEVETRLEENPYYHHAIEFGQLNTLEVALIRQDVNAQQIYNEAVVDRGQRLGNIKPTALDRWPGWAALFAPVVIGRAEATRRSPTTRSTSRATAP